MARLEPEGYGQWRLKEGLPKATAYVEGDKAGVFDQPHALTPEELRGMYFYRFSRRRTDKRLVLCAFDITGESVVFNTDEVTWLEG
jgi:hypothetical protein